MSFYPKRTTTVHHGIARMQFKSTNVLEENKFNQQPRHRSEFTLNNFDVQDLVDIIDINEDVFQHRHAPSRYRQLNSNSKHVDVVVLQ